MKKLNGFWRNSGSAETARRERLGGSGSAGASPSQYDNTETITGRANLPVSRNRETWHMDIDQPTREGEAPAEPPLSEAPAEPPPAESPDKPPEARDPTTSLPQRRKPASGVFVSRGQPTIVFVTVCTRNREPWLAGSAAMEEVVDVWREATAWTVGFFLLMPDHAHLFCAPRDLDISLDNWVKYWKSLFRRRGLPPSWRWQSGKWDTRLRRSESYHEKWEYVRQNPVRKGLVTRPEDWPYQGVLNELRW
jgi:putative transposase